MAVAVKRRPSAPVLFWLAVVFYATVNLLLVQHIRAQGDLKSDRAVSGAITQTVDAPNILVAQSTAAEIADAATEQETLLPLTTHQFMPLVNPQPPGNAADIGPAIASPQIAIIIDDIGYRWNEGKRTAELAGHVTLALLPFSPYVQQLAQLAEQQGKELMLHAPMEPERHHSWRDGLNLLMDEQTIRSELGLMLASLPMVKGVNNHMGSALTQRSEVMSWVMDELAQRKLYFIDSRTSARSTALEQAQRSALLSARRDIFLDNTRTPEAIQRQFDKLLRKARSEGSAIAIGHPYPETLVFLEQALPGLAAEGVQLVPVSWLLLERTAQREQYKAKSPSESLGHLGEREKSPQVSL